jgi:hypothetical protein
MDSPGEPLSWLKEIYRHLNTVKIEMPFLLKWPVLHIEMFLERIGLPQGKVSRAACVAQRYPLRTLKGEEVPKIFFYGPMLDKNKNKGASYDRAPPPWDWPALKPLWPDHND